MTHDDTDDKELDGMLTELRRSYNVPPPAPPLDAMWDEIEQHRFGGRGLGGAWSTLRGTRGLWWMGMAAALIAGIGIGRLTGPRPLEVVTGESARTADHPRRTDSTSYDQTTARYLGQTVALLVSLPAEARAGVTDRRFVARAADLLTTTRLLLDSPAAADPKVRALLEDVELVLAQVAHLEPDRRLEFELIAQALEQRDLLPRLTSAAAGSGEADD